MVRRGNTRGCPRVEADDTPLATSACETITDLMGEVHAARIVGTLAVAGVRVWVLMSAGGRPQRGLTPPERANVSYAQLARTGEELASRYAAPLTIWPLVALLYLALTFPLTRVAEYLERRWRPLTRG